MSTSKAQANDILHRGLWVWLRYWRPDGRSKDWAVRVVCENGHELVERRYGKRIGPAQGRTHEQRYSPYGQAGHGFRQALRLVGKKLREGYTLLGESADLRDACSVGSLAVSAPESEEASGGGGQAIYVELRAASDSDRQSLAAVLWGAAHEIEPALAAAGIGSTEVALAQSSRSYVVLFNNWAFGIANDPEAPAVRSNGLRPAHDDSSRVSGAAIIDPASAPVAALLWFARAASLIRAPGAAIVMADEAGNPIEPSLRHEPDVLSLWDTDVEALRPALEHLELVEPRVDLSVLDAPVANHWF